MLETPQQWGEVAREAPIHAWLEPTTRCNTQCVYCEHGYSKFGEDMEPALFERVADQVLKHVSGIELSGQGEPMLARCFDDVLEECLRRELRVRVRSNGLLLRNRGVVSRLVKQKIDLTLSLDGARRESFETLRPHVEWERMMEALEGLSAARSAAGEAAAVTVKFLMHVTRSNINDLPEMVRLADRFDVKNIAVEIAPELDAWPHASERSLDGHADLAAGPCLEALRQAHRLGVQLILPEMLQDMIAQGDTRHSGAVAKLGRFRRKRALAHLEDKKTKRPPPPVEVCTRWCIHPWRAVFIAADGTVYPCPERAEAMGSLVDREWEDIWNGAAYRSFRKTLHSWNPPTACRRCAAARGINAGNAHARESFFSRFECETVELDAPHVSFVEGFHKPERGDDNRPVRIWMSQSGSISLPRPKGVRFIQIGIEPKRPIPIRVAGECRLNGGRAFAFDNTAETICFPIDDIQDDYLIVFLEMASAIEVEGDDYAHALAVTGLAFLK